MSWIRNAVSLAVEKGTTNSLTRTVRNYADSVVQHAGNAVAGGARLLLPDRIGARNLQSFKNTVKRLEEVSVSCRGVERVQLLRRWLVALKEIERLFAICNAGDYSTSDENIDSPRRPTLVYYIDPDMGDEPKTFRDVFLHSQALEGITLSMILEEPNEEEVSLLLEIYGLCLTGGREVHSVVMNSVQNLAMTLSCYQDEVLIKREELLQLAQNAISGIKINADLARIDAEACSIREELDKLMALQQPLSESYNKSSENGKDATVENLKAALVEIQLCSRLEDLLLKKKSLKNGDSPALHSEKVEKLKVLSESLANSTSQAEKRILDHRFQKEEALKFRVAKSNEVSQLEKDLVTEIGQLERQREELQEALKKVIISLNSLRARLHNAREERDQFDEASNQIIVHLKSKEDELSRSIYSCRTEVEVVNTWINFLEDTWVLQASYTEQKEKQVNGELEKYGEYFVNLAFHLLSTYKESLGSSITRIRSLLDILTASPGSTITSEEEDEISRLKNYSRKNLEEEYLDTEAKFLTTLSVVDTMKKQFYFQTEGIFRKDDQKVKELFDALKEIKDEFDSIERPILVMEASPRKPDTPSTDRPLRSTTPTSASPLATGTQEFKQDVVSNSSLIKEKKLDQKEETIKVDSPLATGTPEFKQNKVSKSSLNEEEKKLKPSEELVKLDPSLKTSAPESKQDEVTSPLNEEEKKLKAKEELVNLGPPLATGAPESKWDEVKLSLNEEDKKLKPKEESVKLGPPFTTEAPDEVSKSSSNEEEKKLKSKEEESVKLDPPLATGAPESKQDEVSKSSLHKEKIFKPKEELTRLDPGLDSDSREGSAEEITDWVFDEVEKDVKSNAPRRINITDDQKDKQDKFI